MFTVHVKDAATQKFLQGAIVCILDKDSAFVDSYGRITIDMGDRKQYFYASVIEGNCPYYFIRREKNGCSTS